MERKIGEIFKYGDYWFQCIESDSCHCDFCDYGEIYVCNKIACASSERSDDKGVYFKKLEKVGEPYEHCGKLYQCYKLPMEIEIRLLPNNCNPIGKDNLVEIEIKQNKEDMEDLDKIKVRDYTKVEELNVMEEKKLNLKPFDIQKAREGKPVCTRDGREARIICFDRVGDFPIVALTDDRDYKEEGVNLYDINGKGSNECFDLMMLPEKKEGWVNVYYDNDSSSHRGCRFIYDTKEQAVKEAGSAYITTIKINWEE